jgi:hypothetical protein
MKFFHTMINKITDFFKSKDHTALLERIARMERNHIILLKRVLEMDGVQLRTAAFTSKVLHTSGDELNKGLHDPKPTIH